MSRSLGTDLAIDGIALGANERLPAGPGMLAGVTASGVSIQGLSAGSRPTSAFSAMSPPSLKASLSLLFGSADSCVMQHILGGHSPTVHRVHQEKAGLRKSGHYTPSHPGNPCNNRPWHNTCRSSVSQRLDCFGSVPSSLSQGDLALSLLPLWLPLALLCAEPAQAKSCTRVTAAVKPASSRYLWLASNACGNTFCNYL